MINKTNDMSPVEIKVALLRAGITQAQIARKTKVHPSHVSRLVEGTKTNDRVRRAIAAAVGIDIKRIWPSIYLYGVARKPGRPKKEHDK